MYKKAVDQSKLSGQSIKYLSEVDSRVKSSAQGIAGDSIAEPVPNFVRTPSEHVISARNNSWIVLGRDRPGSRLSGYGSRGDTQAAMIDLVVGRLGFEVATVNKNGENLWVDNNIKRDAARIYISQKTDIDKNFQICDGKVGNSVTKSGIGIKADAIRIVAREGIKLVTKTDKKNSQGGEIESIVGIDLIAGNDDTDLQPMVKGNSMVEALERLVFHLDKLSGIVDAFLMSQMEFNVALTHHWHPSPYFGMPTGPSEVVVPKGIQTQINLLTKVKKSLISYKSNIASFKITYLSSAGKNYICSRNNNVN